MSDKYILDGRNAKPEPDLMKWAKWFEKADRHVAKDKIGDVRISTVFLGLDHSFGHGDPMLFESMIFGGSLDGEQNRYSTWEQAEAGHKEFVERVKASCH
jgi:hypothetical protein